MPRSHRATDSGGSSGAGEGCSRSSPWEDDPVHTRHLLYISTLSDNVTEIKEPHRVPGQRLAVNYFGVGRSVFTLNICFCIRSGAHVRCQFGPDGGDFKGPGERATPRAVGKPDGHGKDRRDVSGMVRGEWHRPGPGDTIGKPEAFHPQAFRSSWRVVRLPRCSDLRPELTRRRLLSRLPYGHRIGRARDSADSPSFAITPVGAAARDSVVRHSRSH